MHIQFGHRPVGRYIVDVDGCLRATDLRHLTPGAVARLHGGIEDGASIIWETRGQSILLGASDCVELDEDCVAFFRTCRRSQLFRVPLVIAPDRHAGGHGPESLAA